MGVPERPSSDDIVTHDPEANGRDSLVSPDSGVKSLAPVVWREGMHIAQHHLQLRDRYFQDSAAFALSSLFFRPYGVAGLELDHEALLNGTAAIVHARGVMPDGLAFSFPDDPGPKALEIGERFSPTRDSHLLLLTIPALQPGRANCGLDPALADGHVRFMAETVEVTDETTGEDRKSILLGRKNFCLRLDDEDVPAGDLVTLPLARVRRDRTGDFVYDEAFIPPCLQIGGSRRLLELLRRLTGLMEAKSANLAEERGGTSAADFASEEIVSFWLSHTIHSSLPRLRHHLDMRTSHPNELYKDLLRLGGALCTFSMESDPRDLPPYDHDDLTECFASLERHIRAHLGVVMPKRATRIALEQFEDCFWRGGVSDPRSFKDAHWYLEVRTGGSRGRLIQDVPALVKVCSARFIVELVRRAHPGLDLEHIASPPSAISPRLGCEYFRIETSRSGEVHPCWKTMVDSGDVGLYTPEALNDLEFVILIVRED